MNTVLLILFLTSFTSISMAQSNSVKLISKKTGAIINSTTYEVVGDSCQSEKQEDFFTVMNSKDSMLVGIKRRELSIITGTSDYFSWKEVYAPNNAGVYPSVSAVDSVMMHKNDTINLFSVCLIPHFKSGFALYRYIFYPEKSTTDSSYVDILFNVQDKRIYILSKKQNHMPITGIYEIAGDESNLEINEEFEVVQNSLDSMLVGMNRIETFPVTGTENYFAWGKTHSPVIAGSRPNWVAEDSIWLYKNDTVTNLSVYHIPNGIKTPANFTYVFHPNENPCDSSYIAVVFSLNVGIEEQNGLDIWLYPNPVFDRLNIDTKREKFDLFIYDSVGQLQLKAVCIGKSTVDVSMLNPGFYVVRLISDQNETVSRSFLKR